MANSRTRSNPDLGRGSSRNFHWIWYQIWGRSRYDANSREMVAKTSSWVMPRAMSAPLRSVRRNISSPMDSQRPDFCHTEAGCMAGNRNSWPPIASISWRMISPTFWCTRQPSGSME